MHFLVEDSRNRKREWKKKENSFSSSSSSGKRTVKKDDDSNAVSITRNESLKIALFFTEGERKKTKTWSCYEIKDRA